MLNFLIFTLIIFMQALREQALKMKKYLVSCRIAIEDKLLLMVSMPGLCCFPFTVSFLICLLLQSPRHNEKLLVGGSMRDLQCVSP